MNNNFAENIKKIRKDNNLSQEELAEKLGVSRQAISKWESSQAYPEMDKIIQLCNEFNLNIDDLLNKDIREVKGEEETKNNLNKYVDDFLNFITDTITLFSNMTFKSKIKCIFEQCVIMFILFIIFAILYVILRESFSSIFHSITPRKIYNALSSLLEGVYILSSCTISMIILIHIFKTRYLDYYKNLKKEISEEQKKEEQTKKEKEDKETPIETLNRKNKIMYKKNENKIIIRDPKHSEYKFINGLFKFIIGMIKFFALCIAISLCMVLITLFIAFTLTFLIYKTGLLFIGTLGMIITSSIVNIILILIIFNFVFNRKSDKKKLIWTFIISLIIFGISCGSAFIGSLDFEIVEENKDNMKTSYLEIEMKDNMFFYSYDNVEYIEEDISNIKVEYTINDYFEVDYYDNDNGSFHIWTQCINPMKLIKDEIKSINNKKIINLNNAIYNIKIHASKENIDKLKSNELNHNSTVDYYEEVIENYEEEITRYEQELEEYQEKIYSLEEELNTCIYN